MKAKPKHPRANPRRALSSSKPPRAAKDAELFVKHTTVLEEDTQTAPNSLPAFSYAEIDRDFYGLRLLAKELPIAISRLVAHNRPAAADLNQGKCRR
jgi:hypothetical protein